VSKIRTLSQRQEKEKKQAKDSTIEKEKRRRLSLKVIGCL
jgi:hypothetical protein